MLSHAAIMQCQSEAAINIIAWKGYLAPNGNGHSTFK